MHRVNLSVAIVCMVSKKNACPEIFKSSTDLENFLSPANNFTETTATTTQTILDFNENNEMTLKNTNRTEKCFKNRFDWSKTIQGIMLSSIFIGLILTSIIGGWLALVFGPKAVIGITLVVASTLTLLTPLAAQFHYLLFIFFRLVIGIAQVSLKKN